MTLADRLDALLTRPIYECDLETIREAAREIRTIRSERSELIEALTKLRFSAAVLLQNAEGCAVNHYGADYNLHGEPGWMADCRHPIENALLVLSKIKEQKA